ncbi:unnamed protein product, partial [Cyprideis torosa]
MLPVYQGNLKSGNVAGLYHPTILYAYGALIMQGGVLQVIGCMAASRLNERLLNLYWIVLLVLAFGDIVVGFVWFFRLYHPTILYAYGALIMQGGVLQVIGCMAASRLNERLLNLYWIVLLVLAFGDIVVGFVWFFRFQKLCNEITGEVQDRVRMSQHGNERDDYLERLQITAGCCGVTSPLDYDFASTNISTGAPVVLPESCCKLEELLR